MNLFHVTLLGTTLIGSIAANSSLAEMVYSTVALSGTQAPGAPSGANFGTFNAPVLNAAGNAAFGASLTGTAVTSSTNEGIWSEGTGTLSLVARKGAQSPGTPSSANFVTLNGPVLNSAGRTAFRATLDTASSTVTNRNNEGIWSEGTGTLSLVAREGNQAPGTPSGANFGSFNTPVINSAGRTAFHATLDTASSAVTNRNNEGIWSEGIGTLSLVAREGNQAPGTPRGALFNTFNDPVLNIAGQTAFHATLRTAKGVVTNSSNEGIWSEGTGMLSLVAREGSQAPGTPDGALFSTFNDPVLNAVGQTAFHATLSTAKGVVTNSSNEGIWSEGTGTLSLVAREGSQAPGTPNGALFSTFGDPVLNAEGQTAFHATLRTARGIVTANNNEGIWSEELGTLSLVVREGSQAPGTPSGTVFSVFNDPVINGAGQTAFLASLTGSSVTSSNDIGLWAEDPLGGLTLVVREGDLYEVALNDFRTISAINFSSVSGNEDGFGLSFNDDLTLAFGLSFTDGDSGVLTASFISPLLVPEPNQGTFMGSGLCVLGIWLCVRRRRQIKNRAGWLSPHRVSVLSA